MWQIYIIDSCFFRSYIYRLSFYLVFPQTKQKKQGRKWGKLSFQLVLSYILRFMFICIIYQFCLNCLILCYSTHTHGNFPTLNWLRRKKTCILIAKETWKPRAKAFEMSMPSSDNSRWGCTYFITETYSSRTSTWFLLLFK